MEIKTPFKNNIIVVEKKQKGTGSSKKILSTGKEQKQRGNSVYRWTESGIFDLRIMINQF